VKKFFGQYESIIGGVQDSNGTILYEQKDITKSCKKYLKILYEDKTLRKNVENEEEKTVEKE